MSGLWNCRRKRRHNEVGGASGSIAKSISAYDMAFSDAIYGSSPRYVSRQRLQTMLDYEYALLMERLDARRDEVRARDGGAVLERPAGEDRGMVGLGHAQHLLHHGAREADLPAHDPLTGRDARRHDALLDGVRIRGVHAGMGDAGLVDGGARPLRVQQCVRDPGDRGLVQRHGALRWVRRPRPPGPAAGPSARTLPRKASISAREELAAGSLRPSAGAGVRSFAIGPVRRIKPAV